MEFRPWIDIHNGSVKQIVGSGLRDQNDAARENFVAKQDAAFFAGLYREYGIRNGHIIYFFIGIYFKTIFIRN